MVKAGAYELPSQSHSTKAVADSFEVIVAALYLERGFADVCTWVQEQCAPLIAAARESYDKWLIMFVIFTKSPILIHLVSLTTSDRNIPFLSIKRHRGPLDPASNPLLKKIRLSSGRSSPRSTLSKALLYFAAVLPLTAMVSGTACHRPDEIKGQG